jgi:hypothetical protein
MDDMVAVLFPQICGVVVEIPSCGLLHDFLPSIDRFAELTDLH